MYFNVIDAVYIEEYRIKLKFTNGKTGIVNLADIFQRGKFSNLSNL
jgi:hypothetical protein